MKTLYILILKGIELEEKKIQKLRTPQLLQSEFSLKALLYILYTLQVL